MILGVDIGGTEVKLALMDHDGNIHARFSRSVNFDGYVTPVMDTVISACRDALASSPCPPEGIAVSATGQIDARTGTVIGTNGAIPGYEGTPIRSRLEQAFGVPARVLNDANAAALGEYFLGAGRGYQDLLMITLGTGVGGGIILDGRLYQGRLGIAGELGHFTLYQDGPRCTCGKQGCFENYASTSALVRRAGASNGREVFERASAGDPDMLRALDAWTDDVAAGITGLVHIFSPQLILIGGGVSVQEKLLIRPLEEKILHGVMPRFAEHLEVRRALLGNDAGLAGALKFFLDETCAGTSA